jgi:hypothetical protein
MKTNPQIHAEKTLTYHSLMTNIAGVDGCKAGWIALVEQIETRRITAHVFRTFSDPASVLNVSLIAAPARCTGRHR